MRNKFLTILILCFSLIGNCQTFDLNEVLIKDFQIEVQTADFATDELIIKHNSFKNIELKKIKNKYLYLNIVKGNNLEATSGHAIHDLQNYIENRIGKNLALAIRNKQVNINIFSGTEDALFQFLDLNYPKLSEVTKIPSLYEEWGIVKYLIKSNESFSTVLIHIPTSLRYAKHYATMIKQLNNNLSENVIYDKNSYLNESLAMKQGANNILKIINSNYSIVTFGYSDAWLKSLEKTGWIFVSKSTSIDKKTGINAELIKIQSAKSNRIKSILLLSSSRTVWGELASMMIYPFLNKNVEQVLFMGSAGAVSDKNSIYDLSIPERFLDQSGKIDVKNYLSSYQNNIISGDKIKFGATHGNTFSPIEQNTKYLKVIHNQGIDTIDVEQSLLARKISEYNKASGLNIKFSAINLITDKPYVLLQKNKSDFDLDHINRNEKNSSRAKAVEFFLETLDVNDNLKKACIVLF